MSTKHHLKKTTWAKSAEVEEIEDQEAFTHSATPKNPWNVIELSDGSDYEVDGEDVNENKAEEDDEVELSLSYFSMK